MYQPKKRMDKSKTMPAEERGPEEEELIVRASQFKSVLEKFAVKEEEYCRTIDTLEKDNLKLRQELEKRLGASQQVPELQVLLNEQQQANKKLKQENKRVKTELQKLQDMVREKEEENMASSINISSNKLDDLSAIYCTSLQGSLTQSHLRVKHSPYSHKKSRICLKKKKAQQKNQASQLGGLQTQLRLKCESLSKQVNNLKNKLTLTEIDRDHYHKEHQIISAMLKQLQRSIPVPFSNKENHINSSNTSPNCRCVKLEESMGRLTQMVEKQARQIESIQSSQPNSARQEAPPPITPHFSAQSFHFPVVHQHKAHWSPPQDQIFETDSLLQDLSIQ